MCAGRERVVLVGHHGIVDSKCHVGPLRDPYSHAPARNALGEDFSWARPISVHARPVEEEQAAHPRAGNPFLAAKMGRIALGARANSEVVENCALEDTAYRIPTADTELLAGDEHIVG